VDAKTTTGLVEKAHEFRIDQGAVLVRSYRPSFSMWRRESEVVHAQRLLFVVFNTRKWWLARKVKRKNKDSEAIVSVVGSRILLDRFRMLFQDLEFPRNDGMERIVIGGVCLCFWFARGEQLGGFWPVSNWWRYRAVLAAGDGSPLSALD